MAICVVTFALFYAAFLRRQPAKKVSRMLTVEEASRDGYVIFTPTMHGHFNHRGGSHTAFDSFVCCCRTLMPPNDFIASDIRKRNHLKV